MRVLIKRFKMYLFGLFVLALFSFMPNCCVMASEELDWWHVDWWTGEPIQYAKEVELPSVFVNTPFTIADENMEEWEIRAFYLFSEKEVSTSYIQSDVNYVDEYYADYASSVTVSISVPCSYEIHYYTEQGWVLYKGTVLPNVPSISYVMHEEHEPIDLVNHQVIQDAYQEGYTPYSWAFDINGLQCGDKIVWNDPLVSGLDYRIYDYVTGEEIDDTDGYVIATSDDIEEFEKEKSITFRNYCKFKLNVWVGDYEFYYWGEVKGGIPEYSYEILETKDMSKAFLLNCIKDKRYSHYDVKIFEEGAGIDNLYKYATFSTRTINGEEHEILNRDGPWGFINNKGEIIFEEPFAFDLSDFHNGVAIVEIDVFDEILYGLINEKGEWIIEPSGFNITWLEPWGDNDEVEGYLTVYGGKYCVLNSKGKKLWSKNGVKELRYWKDDQFVVRKKDSIGLVDIKGKWLWEKKALKEIQVVDSDTILVFDENGAGLIEVKTGEWIWYKKGIKTLYQWENDMYVISKNVLERLWNENYDNNDVGIIKRDGKMVLNYHKHVTISDEKITFSKESDKDYIRKEYKKTKYSKKEMLALVDSLNKKEWEYGELYPNGKKCQFSHGNRELLDTVVDGRRAFHAWEYVLEEKGKNYSIKRVEYDGIIDAKGKVVARFDNVTINDFADGMLKFLGKDEKGLEQYGYYDKNGNVIVGPKYMRANDFSSGVAIVGQFIGEGVRWGIIDKKGKALTKLKFDRIGEFHDGIAAVEFFGYPYYACGYINTDGKEIVKPIYSEVTDFENGYGLATRRDEDRVDIINKKGKIVAHGIDVHIEEGYYWVDIDEDTCNVYDKNMKLLSTIAGTYREIDIYIVEGYYWVNVGKDICKVYDKNMKLLSTIDGIYRYFDGQYVNCSFGIYAKPNGEVIKKHWYDDATYFESLDCYLYEGKLLRQDESVAWELDDYDVIEDLGDNVFWIENMQDRKKVRITKNW